LHLLKFITELRTQIYRLFLGQKRPMTVWLGGELNLPLMEDDKKKKKKRVRL
jgi:hypothetical protein